jgi:hypothetical protein
LYEKNSFFILFMRNSYGRKQFCQAYVTNREFSADKNVPTDPKYAGFISAVYWGCRYRFNEQAGIFAESGYGVYYISLGFNYRINFSKKEKKTVS